MVTYEGNKPTPIVQEVPAEEAIAALHSGRCDSIHWRATNEQIARNERMYPGSRALYVSCGHPKDRSKLRGIDTHIVSERLSDAGL